MTAPNARHSDELREALAEALETVWHQKTPRGKDRPATRDEVLDALTPVAESLARERAAEITRRVKAIPTYRVLTEDESLGYVALAGDVLAALAADDQPVQP